MHKAFNSIYMECRYIQFSAGDDGVTRRNGREPLKINTSNLISLQHLLSNILNKLDS